MSGSREPNARGWDEFTYQIGSGELVSTAVVKAVAAVSGHEPTGKAIDGNGQQEPLYEVVDPDALDTIYESLTTDGPGTAQVSFTYCGYDVSITPGVVRIQR